jgi:hypothetical protein
MKNGMGVIMGVFEVWESKYIIIIFISQMVIEILKEY